MPDSDVYQRLTEEFDITFTDVRGGVSLTYITGEQVISRLNEVLGIAGWSFRVLRDGLNIEADEYWALGELEALIDGNHVVKQQYGSQKVKRSRSTGTPLDIGFDLKGAGTDAMKKCATLLGVGLYLSKKKAPPASQQRRSGQEHWQSAPKPQTKPRHEQIVDDWNKAREEATKVGIEVKNIEGDDKQLTRWTAMLTEKINEAEAAKNAA
jgi:hypothetical protein